MSQVTLRELALQLSRSNPANREVQELFHERLVEERDRVAQSSHELAGFLDAAAILVRSLVHIDERQAEEIRDMAARIVGLVSDCQLPEGAAPALAPTGAGASAGIQTLNEMALGDVLVQLGLVQTGDIQRALAHQARTGSPLGGSLVELGLASAEDIEQGLRLQHALAQAAASPNPSTAPRVVHSILLGEILVGLGKLDRKQLEKGLEIQRKQGVRIGDALVELGSVSWGDVGEALRLQAEQRGPSRRPTTETIVKLEE